MKGKEEDSFFRNSVSQMLRIVMEEGCSTQKQVLNYLGERFRVKLSLPDWCPNEQAAEFLFKYVWFCLNCIFFFRGAEGVSVVVGCS